MKFISAGHCNDKTSKNYDEGATGVNGRTEAAETVKVRDRVIQYVKAAGYTDIIQDANSESLREYLERAKTGDGSVVCEIHFNAYNSTATGVEVLVGNDSDRLDKACAKELCDATASILKIPNRGVKTEADSHRGRLGLMREQGVVTLIELCFIDNASDMVAYDANFDKLCKAYADILIRYDELVK